MKKCNTDRQVVRILFIKPLLSVVTKIVSLIMTHNIQFKLDIFYTHHDHMHIINVIYLKR